MPIFRSGKGQAPAWCEMEYFDIVRLPPGDKHLFPRMGQREKLIVAKGSCKVALNGQITTAEERANLNLGPEGGEFEVVEALTACTLVRMAGRWGEQTGGSGLFSVQKGDAPVERVDPTNYPKETSFDNHYHDCDEYWILLAGRGTVVSEGITYDVGPGDCLATGMGHHHDFPGVVEPVKAVYFETTLEGQKRRKHLWNHTHGPAQPMAERI